MPSILASLLSFTLLGIGSGIGPGDTIADVLRAQEPSPKPAAIAPAWRPDNPTDVLVMVRGFYDGAKDLEAKFQRSYWNPTFGEKSQTKGTLEVKKPDKMVWDHAGSDEADYYTNGETLWMVEHDTRQVIKTKVSGNSEVDAAIGILFDGDKLLREFYVAYAKSKRAKRYGDADHYVLELDPKTKQAKRYKGLVLVVHATTGRVDGFVVYNTDGSSNHYQFSKIRTNVGLRDKAFDFKLPNNYVETVE